MPLPTRLPLVIASNPLTTASVGVSYVYTVETGMAAQTAAQTQEMTATENLAPEAAGQFTVTAPVLPAWLALENTLEGATLVTGTPGLGDAGEQTVTLELADAQGAIVTQSFTITIGFAPFEVSPLELQVDEDTQLQSQVTATDTAGSTLTYTVEISPAHGVITLTTALDAVTGEPLRQVAGPQRSAPGEETGEQGDTEGGEGAVQGEEPTATVEPTLEITPEATEEVTPEPTPEGGDVVTETLDNVGEVTQDMVTAPAGEGETQAGEAGAEKPLTDVPGGFIYLPDPDFAGEDTFAFNISSAGGFSVTLPVTVTVLPVNDVPQIELDRVITLTPGAEVNMPVVVVDPDADAAAGAPTLTVDTMPPGLALVDGVITGVVAPDAQGPYYSAFTADDMQGGVTVEDVEWAVLPPELQAETPAPTEEAVPTEEAAPTEEVTPAAGDGLESPLPPPAEPTVDAGGAGAAASPIEIPVFAFSNSLPGSGALDGYAWQVPTAFGTCPSTPDALVARPSGLDAHTLADEARAADWANAPALDYTVDLPAAGDYVVAVCGCAPQLTADEVAGSPAPGGDVASSLENNTAIYVGVNGGPAAVDGLGQILPISGYAAAPGYTWQSRWLDVATGTTGAVTVNAAEPGTQTIHLWMADDGLIVYSLRLTPLALANVEPGAAAEACGPSLGATPPVQ